MDDFEISTLGQSDEMPATLLYSERPLNVSPELAAIIGLNETIVLQQIRYWLKYSNHEHDGRRWIYNTYAEWKVQFPFWSERTLQRTVAKLVEMGLVIVHRYNENNWDRTNWYTIDYKTYKQLEADRYKVRLQGEDQKNLIAAKRRTRKRKG